MRVQPEMLTVERGDTIVWVNKDIVPHTATSTSDFAYICSFHPTMKAMLRVE
jgi:plastocyanin